MERASTGDDVISGVSKTRKTECCDLQVCNFLKGNSIRDHFLEISYIFQGTFNKFGEELVFSLALKTVDCTPATPVKKELLEIYRKSTFRNIPMHLLEFLTDLQNTKTYLITLLKSG